MKTSSLLSGFVAVAALSLGAQASAAYDYNGYWVYVWTNTSGGAFGTASNWGAVKNTTQGSLASVTGSPAAADVAYIGYTYSYSNGVQTFSQLSTHPSITVTAGGSPKTLFLGDNVTYQAPAWPDSTRMVYMGENALYTGTSQGFRSGNTYTFDFGSMTGTSRISMRDVWVQACTMKFQGDVTMTGDTFSYTLFAATNLAQNAGTWVASDVSVTDRFGKDLAYAGYVTDATQIGRGQYGLVLDGGSVKLQANGTIPEPATATLSLFGLSALMMRRRRK
ncbi:PEP-CTERM sorting domain-containing protein [Akkermansia glycaniphila]|uniref:Pep exosort: pep-cterm protein-sorting domain n=1 Tax=Akkermansia glycaniphila TaxID=1679444 RepID=A0A1H6M1K5_9BACT|nr:PEP-CTERM sorting domain-containing protein [Akkermansia glycaniphila]SEH91808.1 pep exosort: pep-cterm protein-sorting domain [Akkermansia glycaniphila]